MLSVITPAYNEENNLLSLRERLCTVLDGLGVPWEWIVVDDHSSDATFAVIADLAAADSRVRGLRLSRNSGSHSAILCGLEHARGNVAVVIVGDGQDPPETIPALVEKWRAGGQVVWAARQEAAGAGALNRLLSRLYYAMMRRAIGIRDLPALGADFVLVDHTVMSALRRYRESNLSLFALISWMGFRQASVTYERQPRQGGSSGWTFPKRFKFAIDSVISFSYLPIRLMALLGTLVALAGLAYTPVVVVNRIIGSPVEGWTELMVVVLVIGGFQMLMLAVLGEYLWRTLEEARGRPRFLIEAATPPNESEGSTDHVGPVG